MTAMYNSFDQAWAVRLNGVIQKIRDCRFWECRTDLLDDLRKCGLTLNSSDQVVQISDV